jgi:hypothetical protein
MACLWSEGEGGGMNSEHEIEKWDPQCTSFHLAYLKKVWCVEAADLNFGQRKTKSHP